MATINNINTYLTIGPNSEINKPAQPLFCSYLTADALNITGDNTNAVVPFNGTYYNIGSSFSTVTNKFTAPVTGQYVFGASILLGGIAAQQSAKISIQDAAVTPGSSQNIMRVDLTKTPSNQVTLSCYVVFNLTAGNVTMVYAQVGNAAKAVDVIAGNGSYFWGYLLA